MTSTDPNIAICPSCGTMIDVSEQETFSLVNCSSCGARMRVRTDFANFEIQGVLGEGGQGIVYRAVDKKLGRQVAVKVMKREYSEDPEFVKRFASEARITASLNSQHIVKVYSSGEHGGLLYLAMEVVEHGSLEALMAKLKMMPEEQAVAIGIQIATGLQAGLERGLIHRDIKPGNVLFAEGEVAKIVDFGLAILVEKQHEEQGEVWATPYYVAPEKLAGEAEDFRSDMYSLAASIFHAIAGRPPFISESSSMAELLRIKSQPVRLLNYAPHVSTPTAYAIDRALSFKPEDRFGSYAHFIQALEHALAELRKNPVKRRRPKVLRIGDRVREGSWVTFGAVAAVVGIGLYFWLHRPQAGRGDEKKPGSSGESAEPDLSAEMRFDIGRRQLVEERFADAAKTFGTLYDEGRLPEPKNSWAEAHGGLAEFFAGRPGPGRTKFKTLAERVSPTVIGLDAKLVAFFRQLPKIASGKAKDEPKWDEFSSTGYESLVFLIGGLERWNEGDFEGAIGLMRRFQSAAPAGEDSWVGDYRPLVARYLAEYGTFRDLSADLARADSAPKAAEAALKKLPDALRTIRTKTLAAKLTALEADAREKVTAAGAAADLAMKQKQAETEAADEKLLTEAKFRIKDLCESYRFSEASAFIRAVDVKLDRNISERDLLSRRVDWLVDFKKRLVEDINAAGCPTPLVKKNGQKLLGTASHADDQQLEVRVQFGTLPGVKWTELSPMSILQMARAYMRPTLTQSALADREWQAGVFCLFMQIFNEGQALMDDAVTRKPEYQNDRAQFFGQPAPAPTPAPELAVPAPEKAAPAPEKAPDPAPAPTVQ